MNKDFALEIDNLAYIYTSDWTRKRIHALQDISLKVNQGEAFGFLGHNGAGKTTTIKCILGLIRQSSGSVKIFGNSNHTIESRRDVGYLPEQPYFYDHLSVRELMHMYARLAGVPAADVSSAVEQALHLVKMEARRDSRMRSLSKGLTQRVGMAQAIVAKPKLLILDEPFSGLDPIGRKEFRDLLFNLRQQGTTIFMSSHILSDVEFLCDRVSIMAYGQLKGVYNLKDGMQHGKVGFELVLRNYKSIQYSVSALSSEAVEQGKFLRLLFNSRDQAQKALKLAIEEKVDIESFDTQEGSLENLFVQLVQFEEAGREK